MDEELPPRPMAKLEKKEDVMVDGSTFGSWRKKKNKIDEKREKHARREKKKIIQIKERVKL